MDVDESEEGTIRRSLEMFVAATVRTLFKDAVADLANLQWLIRRFPSI